MLERTKFSVLMSVYHGDQAEFFRQSLDSLLKQSRPPDQIVIVRDGILTAELQQVLDEYTERHSELIHTVHKDKNEGLGKALDLGLKHCKHELVARMDADDVSMEHRFETQIRWMEKNPEIHVLSSSICEFEGDVSNVISIRRLPQSGEELSSFARQRNPINHPTILFRKSFITKAGGYSHFPLFEDYHLMARVIMNGGGLYNIQEPLLYFRLSTNTYNRRRGLSYMSREVKLQCAFLQMGFIGRMRFIGNLLWRVPARLLPMGLLRWLYQRCLRISPQR